MILWTLLSAAWATCPDGIALPEGDWPTAEPLHPEAVAELENYAFPALDPEGRTGVRTDALLILQGGEVVYERYNRDYTAETPHLIWSAAKSLTNALAGVAVKEGRLNLGDSICEHLPGVARCEVTVEHLLEFGSGIAWRETYEGSSPTASSVLAMLYGRGRVDMASFVANQPLRAQPGTAYQYSSGDTNLLSGVVRAVLEPVHGEHYPWATLLDPIGASSAVWERDEAGTYIGSSYIWMKPREMARFGVFLANDGCVGEERLLPERWIHDSIRVNSAIQVNQREWAPGDVQGRQFWLNQSLNGAERPHPDAPADAFGALGHWRQMIWVVPSYDMIVVRTGDDRDGTYSHNDLLRRALALGEQVRAPVVPTPEPVPPMEEQAPQPDTVIPDKYGTSLPRLGTRFAAKQACSCAYVAGLPEEHCRAWIQVSPDIAKVRFHPEEKRVTSRALGGWKSEAFYVDEKVGCALY